MTTKFRQHLAISLRDPDFALGFGAELAKSDFAVTLATARRKAVLTQQALANKAGVTQAYIAKLESAEANPTLGVIGKLMAAMGLRIVVNTEPLLGTGSAPSATGVRWPHDVIKSDLIFTPGTAPSTASSYSQLGPSQQKVPAR